MNQRAQEFLLQMVQHNRVPHALLFLGPSGNGALPLVLAFSQLLQCENAERTAGELDIDDREPISIKGCGVCPACRKSASLTHPDIHFSYPTIGTNAVSTDFLKQWRSALAENPFLDANDWLKHIGAENKQGNINKEECNAIIRKLSLKAFEGRYKILLMWLPEYLGKEGNRLLKLIEEPPEQTVFLLVAENADLILPTIISRCQLVKTEALSDEEVTDGLVRERHLTPERARQLAFLADGNFNTALSLADHPANDEAVLLLDWLRRCWRGNGPELVKWTEEFAKLGRESQKQFLHYGLHFLRELLTFVAAGEENLRLRPEELTTARNLAKVLDIEKIGLLAAMFNDNIYFVERNANPKILFLDTSIRMNQVMKNTA